MENDRTKDPFRKILDEDDLVGLFDEGGRRRRPTETCPGCNGKGKYVGFREVEDPCQMCNGVGEIRDSGGL